jgi:hypothetical protein
MTLTVGITEFRNNIFKYADLVAEGNDVEVERNDGLLFTVAKASRKRNKAAELYDLVKNLGGKFPDWDQNVEEMRVNDAEKEYAKRFNNW